MAQKETEAAPLRPGPRDPGRELKERWRLAGWGSWDLERLAAPPWYPLPVGTAACMMS